MAKTSSVLGSFRIYKLYLDLLYYSMFKTIFGSHIDAHSLAGPARELTTDYGVYCIWCTSNNKMYIGSSAGKRGLRGRRASHIGTLRARKHRAPHLQRAFDKYGECAFLFIVLEITSKENALAREQVYLDAYNPWDREVGFNTCTDATSRLGVKHTEATKRKLSVTLRNLPAEVRARITAARPPIDDSLRKRYAVDYAKPYKLEKNGVIEEGNSRKQFALKYTLDASHVCDVVNGKWHSVDGWYRPGEQPTWKKAMEGRKNYSKTLVLRPEVKHKPRIANSTKKTKTKE